ncbi:hypothetical protein GCM10010964_35370 [Caldovatus sediminis]|uniref:Uncharacterized protein n=1 Tax=Caldovatus sediminis TaxID=2041189 RepID=A0A8J2ZEC7_9PROT|nr:hypothetical protein [Caldovatus sediminis]GGG44885.1 hypothetical protein GCM10010964_35370 [Caldovatus sediminis]
MRLRWVRGRAAEGDGPDDPDRTREWVGCDDAGEAIARVVRVSGPVRAGWRLRYAVARDAEARVVELRPPVDRNRRWLIVIGGRVVGRAALPLQAVRGAEAALGGG